MDQNEKIFTTSTLAAAAGVSPVTFSTWRNRNGLFPETAGGGKWNRFSIKDICVVRAVVNLTRGGMNAQQAIRIAETAVAPAIASLLDDETEVSFVVVFRDTDNSEANAHAVQAYGKDPIGSISDKSEYAETGIVINFWAIIHHVMEALITLKPEVIATTDEVKNIVFSALVKGLSDGAEKESK